MAGVYTAGAIDRVSVEEASGWRRQVAEALGRVGIPVLDPMSQSIEGLTPMQVYAQNQALLEQADVVLAELVAPTLHYGTVVEVEWAVAHGVPVVAWIGERPVPVYLARHGAKVLVAQDLKRAILLARALARVRMLRAG